MRVDSDEREYYVQRRVNTSDNYGPKQAHEANYTIQKRTPQTPPRNIPKKRIQNPYPEDASDKRTPKTHPKNAWKNASEKPIILLTMV
jgi:hypothetical protein